MSTRLGPSAPRQVSSIREVSGCTSESIGRAERTSFASSTRGSCRRAVRLRAQRAWDQRRARAADEARRPGRAAGCDRAAGRSARRPAARGGHGWCRSTRTPSTRPAALGGRRQRSRRRRRVPARRLLRTDRHRLRPLRRSTQRRGAAGARPLRDDHVRPCRRDQPAGGAARPALAGARDLRRLTGRSRSTSWSATRPREHPLGEAPGAFLRRHSYCGAAAQRAARRLRQAPRPGHALDPDVVGELVHARRGSCARCSRRSPTSTARSRRPRPARQGALLRPLPRVGRSASASWWPRSDRCSSAPPAPTRPPPLCGAAPITKRSGQQRAVTFRYATNTKARKAITLYADNSRRASPGPSASTATPRARLPPRHAPHPRPRLVRVIWACWHTDTPYDPAPRGDALQPCDRAHRSLSSISCLIRWATSAGSLPSISAPSPFDGTNIRVTRAAGSPRSPGSTTSISFCSACLMARSVA